MALYLISLSGRGRGEHSYYLLALQLDYIGSNNGMEDAGGGGGHTLQPHSLGTGDK